MRKALFAAAAMVMAGCASAPSLEMPAVAGDGVRPTDCLRFTGSHIAIAGRYCLAGPGRVYTHEDIDRTGAVTLDDALMRLGVF